MNKVFKIIWNTALNRFDVVSEFTKAGKKCKASTSSQPVNILTSLSLIVGLGAFFAGSVWADPLPSIIVNNILSESDVERDSATGPAVAVTSGGDYTGTNVTITSQAPASGGNTAAFYVNTGGKASLDASSNIIMNSSSLATVCCSYGLVVDGAGSVVDSSATILGSTGGAGVYNGGLLNLNGGSLSGLFGIVSSGVGSVISGYADITGSGAGTGVRAELGGSVVLSGGNILSNGMTATGSGSSISATALTVNGKVNANNGANISLDGGSVSAGGFGAVGVLADGSPSSYVTTSTDITMTGGGGGSTAISARNGATVDITGGNVVGDTYGITAVTGGQVSVSNANVTSNNTGVYAADNGSRVTLNSGIISMPGWNNVGVTVTGAGATIENLGVTIVGGGTSSIGAQANNGGAFILASGGTMTGSGTGVKANGLGSSVVSSGTISATQRAVNATSNGSVTLNGGSLTTTVAGSTGIVAESAGQVYVTDASLLDTAILAGSGIQAISGGVINLAGGTLSINANSSLGLIIDGAGSTINSSAPLSVNVSGSSGKAISVANGASQAFQGLTASVTGSNSNVIQSNGGANQLTLTGSTLSSTQGAAIVGQSDSLNLVVSDSQVSGPVLVQDNGSTIDITASDNSVISGSSSAANSSITLDTDSVWNIGAGSSTLASLSLDNGTMRNMGTGSLSLSGDVTLGSNGGRFDTNGFDAVLATSAITGTGNFTKNGMGKLTIDAGINYTGNTVISEGTLQIGSGSATGNVSLHHVDNSGILAFDRPDLVTVDRVEGSGAVEQNGSGMTVFLGDNTYTGGTTITAGTLQLGNGGSTGSVQGNIDIQANGILAILRDGAVTLGNTLTGSGLITTDTTGQAFDLGAGAGNAFTGTLAVGNGTFMLDGTNTFELNNATLRAAAGSTVTVGSGIQTIGGLAFDGGTLKFDVGTPGETVAATTIHTTQGMNLLGTGTVALNIDSVDNSQTPVNPVLPIMEQDGANVLLQLAASDVAVQGNGGNLVLKDQYGNIITDVTTADIAQNGTTVAKGTYDYRLTSGVDNDGLYVAYGLTQVELLGSGADALSLYATTQTGPAADLSAKITGSGDLAIDTSAGKTVTLSNLDNDYTGSTEVRSGTLQMLNDNVLGNTSLLSLATDTALDMNGHSQTVGELSGAAGSLLDLNGGSLILSRGGVSDGELTGSGALTIAADTLTINGANSGLSATTTIASGALAALNNVAGLGNGDIINAGLLTLTGVAGNLVNNISGTGNVVLQNNSDITASGNNSQFSGLLDINTGSQLTASQEASLGSASVTNNGSLILNSATDWTLANRVSGTGNLTKNGAGTVSLTQSASYSGQTDINAGGLILGSNVNPTTLASQQVNIANGAFMGGFGGVVGAVNNNGTLFVGNPVTPVTSILSRLSPASNVFTVGTDLINSGTVFVGNTANTGTTGNQLVVNGNYIGNNGLLHFNTALGDDNSATDSMIVNGNTSGTTHVSVDNAGGLGAKTLNGIELIQVNGQSDGDFVQSGRIVAGAYDYSLARGVDSNASNWYLSSTANGIAPDPSVLIKRPEASGYATNLAAANNMFVTSLHDRLGETQYIDALTGEHKVTSLWLRNSGGHNRSRDTENQLGTQANRYVVQLGGDIAQWSHNGQDRFHLGVMAGYANSKSRTESRLSGYSARASVDGYSTGVYGTWYANESDKSGLYVDGWAQYSWFNNTVDGQDLNTEKYKSKGVTASIESGYTFKVGENTAKNATYFIQPKAQVTWMGVKADDHKEVNGTHVSGEGDGNIQTRLGVKAFMNGYNSQDKGKDRVFQPYIEANWIHNTKDFGTNMDGQQVKQDGAANIGELKVGVEGQINKQVNLWGNVGQQIG
ncbi:autotransporter outer membrane beta-barrel domain-containing protein, partial [Yersinia frederiksenii]